MNNDLDRRVLLGAAGLAGLAAIASRPAAGGPINPPAGSVAGTGKTLSEVEPRVAINPVNTPGTATSTFRITQPGSYYLTGNVTGSVGKHGIDIAVGGVTVDLCGFELSGVAGMGAFSGVFASVFGLRSITVRNGTFRGWGASGVDLSTNAATGCRIESVTANENGSGIFSGENAQIVNCQANANVNNGVTSGTGSVLSGLVATLNGGFGIYFNSGSSGVGCTAARNSGPGFGAASGVSVSACSAYDNNSQGFSLSDTCAVTNCAANNNSGHGFFVQSSSTVSGCAARANDLDGIRCTNWCFISGNNCIVNGNGGDGAGVHATGFDNRIEGNNCVLNDRGIDVDSAGNIIVRNTCSGNSTNWDIVANNVYGPIIDRTSPASPAVLSNAAAGSTVSTDPHANFTY